MKTRRSLTPLAIVLSLVTALALYIVLNEPASATQPTAGAEPDRLAITSNIVSDGLAYVPLDAGDLVDLVDTTSHNVVGTVDVGTEGCDYPWRAAMSPDGSEVYVSCYSSGSVAVIETAGNTVSDIISGIADADGLAFSRDGALALVGSRWAHQFAAIDTANHSYTIIPAPAEVRSLAAHPALDRAYATCANGTILVIDTTSLDIIASISVGSEPWDVVVSPDGQWVFASDRWGAGLAVIDASTDTLHTTVTDLGELTGLEVAPDGSEVYACGLWNGVHVIDISTFSHVTTVPDVGKTWDAAITCDGRELYVGDTSSDIPIIDTETHTVIGLVPLTSSGARGIAICPQTVGAGVFLNPPAQTNSAALGELVSHEGTLLNLTGATDSFDLALGNHAWDTSLSTSIVGPLHGGASATFTVYVTVPVGSGWYSTATVVLTATSVTSPQVYSDSAAFTTRAYAPPQMAVSPDQLTSTQYINVVTSQPLAISNGNGVTLTLEVKTGNEAGPTLEEILAAMNGGFQAIIDAIPDRYDFSEGETGVCISDGGDDMYDGGNCLSTNYGGYIEYSNNLIVGSPLFGPSGRYFTRKYPGLFLLVADMEDVDYFEIVGDLGADGSGSADGTILQADLYGITYYGFVKRVYDASDPSVNHLIIVADNPAADHTYSEGTNEDFHQVTNLGPSTRLYYLLYAGSNGAYIDDDATLNIMQTFLAALGLPAPTPWLSADPTSGDVPARSSLPVEVTFDASSMALGDYAAKLVIVSNDPARPWVSIPVTMTVVEREATLVYLPLVIRNR